MKFDEFIQYGDVKHAAEFTKLNPMTIQAAYVASVLAKSCFGSILMTTSIFRKKTNDSGIHEQYRAIDFRLLPSIEDTYRLVEIINSIYTYDPDRRQFNVAHPDPYHGTGPHIHIQTHPKTCVMTPSQKELIAVIAQHDMHNFQAKPLGETKET